MNKYTPEELEKFWDRVAADPNSGCWIWIGAMHENGYALFGEKGKGRSIRAHRQAYEHFVGEIPDGLILDHKCRVRCCVNPDHLEPVTYSENNLRGMRGKLATEAAKKRTHCPKGHPYSGRNLYVSSDGAKRCRACRKVQSRNHKARKAREKDNG